MLFVMASLFLEHFTDAHKDCWDSEFSQKILKPLYSFRAEL